jgi:hypothetical protein
MKDGFVFEYEQREKACIGKSAARGGFTFTLVDQDRSAAKIVCLWISENIETCPEGKLRSAFEFALHSRGLENRKPAD